MRLFSPPCLLLRSHYLRRSDFSSAKLTAPPTGNWPTNGGNLYNSATHR